MTPIPGLPDGVLAQVRPHLKETTGYVLASRGDCLDLQRREIDSIKNRTFRPVAPKDLQKLQLPPSWILGVLLCPNDDTAVLTAWALRLSGPDQARLRFYALTGTNLAHALSDWIRAGLGAVQYVEVGSWEKFHHRFGADHAIRVYQDHVYGRERQAGPRTKG